MKWIVMVVVMLALSLPRAEVSMAEQKGTTSAV